MCTRIQDVIRESFLLSLFRVLRVEFFFDLFFPRKSLGPLNVLSLSRSAVLRHLPLGDVPPVPWTLLVRWIDRAVDVSSSPLFLPSSFSFSFFFFFFFFLRKFLWTVVSSRDTHARNHCRGSFAFSNKRVGFLSNVGSSREQSNRWTRIARPVVFNCTSNKILADVNGSSGEEGRFRFFTWMRTKEKTASHFNELNDIVKRLNRFQSETNILYPINSTMAFYAFSIRARETRNRRAYLYFSFLFFLFFFSR